MNSCVIKNEDFYSLAEEHGIDGSELELIVHKYWNEVGKEDSFPPSSYINEQLGIGKSYDEASENVRKLWERDYSRPIKFKSEFELNGAVQKAKTFFPVDAITTYKDSNSNYILRIAEPIHPALIEQFKSYEEFITFHESEEIIAFAEIEDILAKAPRDSQGRLLAPNGKVSNLTEKQYAQVRTKAFKKWFGDWTKITFDDNGTPIIPNDVSKVVDENGEPLVVYHGNTDTNITKFTKGKGRYLKDGNYYFSPSKSVAESYATNGLSEDIDINDYLVIGYNVDANSEEAKYADFNSVEEFFNASLEGKIYSVFLNIKNPLFSDTITPKIENPYDGAITIPVKDTQGTLRGEKVRQYIATSSNQIKSATDNIGTFSTTDDNMNHDTTTANVVSSSSISYIGQKEATTRVQSFIDSIDKSGEYGQAIQEFIDTFGLPVVNEVIFNITQANTHSSSWNNFTRALKLGFSEMASSEEKAAVTLHELIHSRTTSLANLYEKAHGVKSLKSKEKSKVFESLSSDALTPEIEKAFDNIVECKAEVLKYLEENPEIKEALLSTDVTTNLNKRPLYAILKETDKYRVREFISEIYTNPAFIQLLKSIPTKVKKQSLWDKFVNALRSIFGKKKTYISVLDRARENADVIVRAGNNVTTAFETISEDASSLPIGQQRAQLRNYYSSLQTRSSQEFKQVKSLASQFFKSQHTFASESAAKAIADKYIRDNHIDSDMVAYTYGYKVPNQQFFVPVIKWKSDAEYSNAKYVSARDYVNSLTNSDVESEILRLSTDEEMFDSTFTFNDGTTIDTPFELNDQQKIALQKLDDFANDKSKTAITLSGYAGTGKTSLMEMVAQKLRRRHNVVFSATTHQAAGVLKSKVGKYGFDTRTVNSLFGIAIATDMEGTRYDASKKIRIDAEDKLNYGDIVIIDEASMLSDENYNDVVDIAKNRNAKVIFVGDKAQLAPVGQNEVSKVFRDANGEVVELTKVERTGDNAILSEATAIRNGQNFTYESAFNAQGQGVAYVTPQSTDIISSIIETFTPGLKTNPNYLRILAFTNASVANYNSKVRQSLGYNGLAPQVGEPMLGYANWGYDRSRASSGDPYQFVNSRSYKVVATQAPYKSGVRLSDGTVCSFDILPLRLEDSMGEQVTVPFIDIKNNIQNRNSAKLAAQEKAILWTKWRTAQGMQKKALLDAINELENFLFINDNLTGDQNNLLQGKVIDFGYAHTIHKSQGGTYTHVIMDDGGIEGSRSSAEMKQQLKYVGVSRATDTVTIISPQTKKADSPINHMQVGPEEVNNSNIAPTRPQNTQTESINIYAGTGENAHLNNFAIRPFTHTWGNGNTMQMQSVEQAFQIAKAATAKDTESIRKMQQTTDGATLRKLGRAVKGLDVAQWDANKANWMKVFIKESFMQNPKALEQLLATGNATLTHTQDKSTWGQMFPQILMQVREELRNYTPEEHPIRQTLVEQFSNYFGDGIEALHKDYPGISQEMLDKFKEFAYTDADMTEADAKRFLGEAKSKSTKVYDLPNNVNTAHEPVRLVNFDKHLDFTIDVGKTYNAKLGDRIVPLTILGKEQEEGRLATDIWFISPELNEAASISSGTMAEWIEGGKSSILPTSTQATTDKTVTVATTATAKRFLEEAKNKSSAIPVAPVSQTFSHIFIDNFGKRREVKFFSVEQAIQYARMDELFRHFINIPSVISYYGKNRAKEEYARIKSLIGKVKWNIAKARNAEELAQISDFKPTSSNSQIQSYIDDFFGPTTNLNLEGKPRPNNVWAQMEGNVRSVLESEMREQNALSQKVSSPILTTPSQNINRTLETIAEFKNSSKPEANNTQEQRAPEVFNDNKTSVDIVSSNKTILSNEELQQWNEAGLGEKPRILVASEHTDPVFHVNKILDILEGKSSVNEWGIVNGKRQVVGQVSGKDFAGLYLVTKHDGLPMKRILETKIPKLIHFSITSLGGTKYEPGVMKANDLLDRIGEYIKQGLDPKSITIRIDPIVPGVTTKEGIENIVKRASEMGIRRIRFSIMDAYPNTQLAMEKLGYDFSQYYTRKADGKYNFFANTSYIEDMCNFMLSLKGKYDVTLGTCAEAIAKNGISKEGCLSVSSVNEMLGTSIEDKGTANNEQRKLCSCYGGKIDALQYNSNCASHCVYCYAKHENDIAMQYYNEDGTLKDNDFTRTSSTSTPLQDPRVALAEHTPPQQGSTDMLPPVSPIDTTTPANQIPAPNAEGPLKGFTLHSGGAIGADFAWGNIGASYGVSGKHYFDATDTREGKRPPYGNTPITDEDRTIGERKVFRAGKQMGRLSSKAQKITDPLLIRDWNQTNNADMIVAIAQKFDMPGDKFSNKPDDDRVALIQQVSGGTGWAVQMAISEGKPVFVFNQADGKWYMNFMGVWKYAEAPVLSNNFAGIGTRGINAAGEAAIRECYEKTVAAINNQAAMPTVEEAVTQAEKPFDRSTLSKEMQEEFDRLTKRTTQINNILSSGVMTSIEAREIVDSLMNLITDYITEIINDPAINDVALKEQGNDAYLANLLVNKNFEGLIAPFNPKGLTRLEIINKIGIDNLVNVFLKSKLIANVNTTRAQAKKMRVLSQNLDAILYLGANTLSINEGIHLTTTRINGKEMKTMEEGVVVNPDLNSARDLESMQENEGSLQEKWQVDSRTVDVVESMSQLVRNELFKLYQLDSNGNKITDGIGIYKRVPVQETTKQLLSWLQGCLTLQDVVARLKDKQVANPWVKQLIDILDVEALGENAGQYTDFQNSFFSVFNKHFQSYSATTIKYDKDGVSHIKRISLNEKPFLKETLGQIKVNIASGIHPLFTANNGINQLAFENFKTVLDTLHTIRDNKIAKIGFDKMSGADRQLAFEAISQAASLLGYPTDATTLGNLLTGREIRNMITNLDNMYDDILANITNPNYEPLTFTKGENGKRGSGIRGSLSNFLEPLTKHLADITVSSTFDSGKMYQSYVTPSYMTKLMLKFSEKDPVKFNQFIQEEFGKYDWFRDTSIRDTKAGWRSGWLGILARDAAARKVFKHEAKLNYNKHNYMKNMTGNEYIMSLLSSFFSEGAGNGKDGAVAWYRIPILSNKPSEEYIRFYADMGQDYKEVISTKMAKVFNQELSRIQTVRMQNYDKSDPRFIKNFHENGKRFCFLDFMNVYLEGGTEANTELGKLLNAKLEGTNWDVANEPRLLDLAKQAIQTNMKTRINEILKNYEARGIMEIAENIEGIKQGFGKDNIAENIERFLWNDTYAATQIIQLTVTDIAYYKDMEDLQKRIAQIHAPGVRGNAEAVDYEGNRVSDGLERTIYLTDFDKVKSNIIANVKIVFDRKLEELKNQPLENFSNTKLKTDEDIQKATEAKKHRIMVQEELHNSILKQFEDINVADAQGYSSPTSYRKKMFIFGKWSREAENIYQKLLTGDYNYHDLQVAFQPLKPFVYSQIEKPTGLENGPLKSLKMPVQNKNSEYLLIMADAILQGEDTGQPNLLRAIYEVMEESAKSSPTKGIDTIQFESTVKSGLMGRNDINRVLGGGKWNELIEVKDPNTGKTVQRTRGEVAAKAYLQNNLYIKNEQGKVIGYNPTFVHEIPFEDYCIQQEVPEHFKDHDQQHGSQIRMITPSDLLSVDAYGKLVTYNVEGRELSAKEFREEYENTIADNIQQSIDELVKELHLDAANQVEKNIILSRMLQDEILSSPTRYGLDMFLACSLNPFTGEFRIPLGDPIQANRIEQLLNSIIKKRVNEQKIAGGPVVQVSNFGTSRRLNIRFKDKNGGLLKTREEFTKDWKPVEPAKMDVKSLANKLMKEEKLSYMIALKEAKRRIEEAQSTPQQTADEAYEQYIKNNQGGIAYFEVFASIFNEEIFHRFADPDGTIDIATMEKVCPEALQMIGYRIPTEDKYSCAPIKIVGFLPREAGEGIMLPYDITLLTGSDFDVDKEYLMRKKIHIKPKPFNETFKIMFPEFLEAKKKESKLTRDFTKQEKTWLKIEFTNMLNSFIGTEKVDGEVMYDVHNYQREAMSSAIEKQMWDIFKLVGYKVSKANKGKLYRDNKIFDMTWEVLSHETTADKMLNPGGFEEQKFESYLIEAFRNGTYSWEEYNDLGKKKLQLKDGKLEPYNEQDIKDKKASTGIEALKKLSYNTKNLIFSDSQVQFYEQNNAASTILGMFAVQKIGHAVLESNGYQVDIEEACDIAEPFTILGKKFGGRMEFDPMIDDEGNVIGKTLGSHVAAAADAAKEPCMNLLNINSMTANVHSTLIRLGMPFRHASLFLAQPVIRELLDRYNKRNLTDFASLDTILNEYIQEFRNEGNMMDSAIEHEEITEEELIENLRANKPETNYKVATAFGKLQRLAYAIKGPTYLTRYNSISNAVGPLITDNIVTEFKTNYETAGLYDRHGHELTPEIVFADHPILRKFADAYKLANKIFEDFPTKSQAFSEVLESIPGSLQDKFLNDRELLNDLKDFFLSHTLVDNRVVNENRAGYYIKEFSKEFAANGIKEKNLDNEFIQTIKIKQDKDTGEFSLELSTTGMEQKKKDRLSDSWYELYKKNQPLAMDLFNYCFFRGGIGFNPKTFMNLLPLAMREEIPGYKESFTNIPTESAKYILEQFLAHNTSNYKLFPIKEGEKDVIGGGIIIQDRNELSQYADTPSFRIKDSNGKWRYLLLDKATEDGLAYKEIIPLGDNGEYLEMSSTRVPKISIREIYGTNKKAKQAPQQQKALVQKEVTSNSNHPIDDTSRGLVTPTPAQEKSKAERLIRGIMNSELGMRTPELAKKYLTNNAIINADGKVEISNPTVWKYISAAMESQGLKANKEELLDVLKQLC